jgi:opacity protein-like surface antigen
MRKFFLLLAVAAALVIPAAAFAATWDNTKNGDWVALGAACPTGGSGSHTGGAWYHFVLNQVSPDYFGLQAITLRATFAGSGPNTVTPTVVQKKVIHFDIFGVGMIQSALTDPVGTGATSNLVISGAVCGKKGDDRPRGDS